MTMFINAGMLGFDSFIASLALGPIIQTPAQRWWLAGLFGICDALALVIGFAIHGVKWGGQFAHQIGPIFTLSCGVCLLVGVCSKRFRADRRWCYWLPVLMSFDNFAYGSGLGAHAGGLMPHAAILGLASFFLAWLGLLASGPLRVSNPRTSESSAGIGLITAGLVLLLA